MDFDRAQQVLEAVQAQCPGTDVREIAIWTSAITRAREALFELQVTEDRAIAAGDIAPRSAVPADARASAFRPVKGP